MSKCRKESPLRVLVMGGSESNRRRVPSLGVEANKAWAATLEQRNNVRGYWPTFFMHGIDARISGEPFPDHDALCAFGKGRYLYDRRFIYQWRHSELWNIATPANIARFGLYYLDAHREKLHSFAPDITILCLGSVDCLEMTLTRAAEDIAEIGEAANLAPGASLTFDFCRTAEDFRDVLTRIAELITWISGGGTVLHLDILAGRKQSRSYKKRVRAYSDVVRDISREFHFQHVTHPLMSGCPDEDRNIWYRQDDCHPTDALNEHLASWMLECIPDLPSPRRVTGTYPAPVVRVADWTEETFPCS